MTTVKNIYDFLNDFAPFDTAMNYDNVGLLVGDMNIQVKNVLLALDITKDVVDEAAKNKVDMIISHHPVIFKPLKSISFRGVHYNLIKNNIAALCAHTNLDIAHKGVNYQLANAIGVEEFMFLSDFGIIGDCKQTFDNVMDFAIYIKKSLNAEGVRFTDIKKTISKVAVCCGSGGNFVYDAAKYGADVLVTGEIKHNQILDANEMGIAVVDAGHFKTEDVVVEPLKIFLEKRFPEVTFKKSEVCSDKIKYV